MCDRGLTLGDLIGVLHEVSCCGWMELPSMGCEGQDKSLLAGARTYTRKIPAVQQLAALTVSCALTLTYRYPVTGLMVVSLRAHMCSDCVIWAAALEKKH